MCGMEGPKCSDYLFLLPFLVSTSLKFMQITVSCFLSLYILFHFLKLYHPVAIVHHANSKDNIQGINVLFQQNVNEGHYEEAIKYYKAAMELVKSEPEEHVSPSVTLKIVDQVS